MTATQMMRTPSQSATEVRSDKKRGIFTPKADTFRLLSKVMKLYGFEIKIRYREKLPRKSPRNATKNRGEGEVPRMSKKHKLLWSLFLNDRGRITYNRLCCRCRNPCKQSFRAEIICCSLYCSKRSIQNNKLEG